ncbi:class I SAM-dependent methyltransferase [Allosediminivita pacifica]|uniref:Methyltransferase family protein n=1 Tax=Allosediminivita pacifica TaxID=1267769 RepID=A0A2T6B5P8_9RHOB|nr:class I SAM-dependent methyltransferase [Allosediminivita pacifica]PTX51378.1 methyltransferase family protein [Allosediminivita pacifica]
MSDMTCRHCRAPLYKKILDLGHAPPSNAYLTQAALAEPETWYPLQLFLCTGCGLVQTRDFAAPEDIFGSDYVYFSSASEHWLGHAARFCRAATERLGLDKDSHVVEIASNDGYLLRNFVRAGISCLGIEPTASTAEAARAWDVPVRQAFFGKTLASELRQDRAADLLIGNNVLAHVPDINDFAEGLATLLAPEGAISLEFPHLLRLVEEGQFDTVYHEHYSYLSLGTVSRILGAAGLRVFDVEELPTHGGSLRIWACHKAAAQKMASSVAQALQHEEACGITEPAYFEDLQARADKAAAALRNFLADCERHNQRVAAYGAAAKGTTLLNYARTDARQIAYVCDGAPFKQGRFLPGCHVPVVGPEVLRGDPPDKLLILPWNLVDEIAPALRWLEKEHGTELMTTLPEPRPLAHGAAEIPHAAGAGG